jgi:hypothetical protein
MTLRVRVHPRGWTARFEREEVVRVGRGRDNDIRVGLDQVDGRWTVSRHHAELLWDGSRWSTRNLSDKPGLLCVYEPGYEEVPLEPGRPWVPVRHRWSLGIGWPDHRFHVVCRTDDHLGPAVLAEAGERSSLVGDEEPTAALDTVFALSLTPLERQVLLAYYSDFTLLPRAPTLEPRSHDDAARRVGRSKDSTRKAIERVNEKIARVDAAPPVAAGRTVSAEIGRWLARTGAIDPD